MPGSKLRVITVTPEFGHTGAGQLLRLRTGELLRVIIPSAAIYVPCTSTSYENTNNDINTQIECRTNHPETPPTPNAFSAREDARMLTDVRGLLDFTASSMRRSLPPVPAPSIDPGAFYVDLPIVCPGGWSIAIRRARDNAICSIDFSVAPELAFHRPEAACVLTVHARCLGPVDQWLERITPWVQAGYNTIHLTPVSAHGTSAYSITDPLGFDGNATEGSLRRFVEGVHALGGIVICDCVLNHLAYDAPFLARCPDAAYNTRNTPQLSAALMLDLLLRWTSNTIAAGDLGAGMTSDLCGTAPALTTHQLTALARGAMTLDDIVATRRHQPPPLGLDAAKAAFLGRVEELLRSRTLPLLVLEAWLAAPETETVLNLAAAAAASLVPEIICRDIATTSGVLNYEGISLDPVAGDVARAVARDCITSSPPHPAASRYGGPGWSWKAICTAFYRSLSAEHRPCGTDDARALFATRFSRWFTHTLVPIWNTEFVPRIINDTTTSVIRACLGHVAYERFDPAGRLYRMPIMPEEPLFPRYFTLPAQFQHLWDLTLDTGSLDSLPADLFGLACNGWVMGADPTADFAADGAAYLQRGVIVWSDCVKLRYLEHPVSINAGLTAHRLFEQCLDEPSPACPELWQLMTEYVILLASIFDGLRIDNAHSTPLSVAAPLLHLVRTRVRPNVFVIAELFSGSQARDRRFCEALGLDSLIRELSQARTHEDVSGLVFGVGGGVSGALADPLWHRGGFPGRLSRKSGGLPAVVFDRTHDNIPLAGDASRHVEDVLAGAAVCTAMADGLGSVWGHDMLVPEHIPVTAARLYSRPRLNQPIADQLANAVSAAFTETIAHESFRISGQAAILHMRAALNRLHWRLANEAFSESHVHRDGGVLSVFRHSPKTNRGVVFIIMPALSSQTSCSPSSVRLPLLGTQLIMAGRVTATDFAGVTQGEEWVGADITVEAAVGGRGAPSVGFMLSSDRLSVDINAPPGAFAIFEVGIDEQTRATLRDFDTQIMVPLHRLGLALDPVSVPQIPQAGAAAGAQQHRLAFETAINNMSIYQLSYLLYTSPAEQATGCPAVFCPQTPHCDGLLTPARAQRIAADSLFDMAYPPTWGHPTSAYAVPGAPALPWTGVAAVARAFARIRRADDMGDPLCANVRDGTWLVEYLGNRLRPLPVGVSSLSEIEAAHGVADLVPAVKAYDAWIHSTDSGCAPMIALADEISDWAARIRRVPFWMRPKVTDLVVTAIATAAEAALLRQLLPQAFGAALKFSPTPALVRQLASNSVAFMNSQMGLLVDPLTLTAKSDLLTVLPVNLNAGFDHFVSGVFRNWGRDTFIALPGLACATKQFGPALCVILAYASVVRHGQVPNLFDNGRRPRYNARDATWFFLAAVTRLILESPSGANILNCVVERRFPYDDQALYVADELTGAYVLSPAGHAKAQAEGRLQMTLGQIIDEILDCAWRGKSFREWDAGSKIDSHMVDAGFTVTYGVNTPRAGFICGGNRHNCGTWMDKMQPTGIPNTPRDGCAVELTCLARSVLAVFAHHTEVNKIIKQIVGGTTFECTTLGEWSDMIARNFRSHFFVPLDPLEDGSCHVNSAFAWARGYVRDTIGGCDEWRDYQLRPNAAVGIGACVRLAKLMKRCNLMEAGLWADPCTAGGLLKPEDIASHMRLVRAQLWSDAPSQIGIKTLASSDWGYRGYYTLVPGQTDPAVADGASYHNGPEWVWPVGGYLECEKVTGTSVGSLYASLNALSNHLLYDSPYSSLPELTQAGGAYCADSCQAQAWSVGCVLDALLNCLPK